MLNNTPIEETFRDAFDNFEADVNPQVWTNIETQITTPAAPGAGGAASQVAKTILSASKFSTLTYGIASSVIIAIVAATYFYLLPDKKDSSNITNTITAEQPVVTENKIIPTTENITAETKHENNLSSQKLSEKKSNKPVAHVGGVTPVVASPMNAATNSGDSAITSAPTETNSSQEESSKNSSEQSANLSDKKTQPAANETHETPLMEQPPTSEKELPLLAPTQDDNFDWGIIPNVMSPNNDGINDVFEVKTPDLKSIEVTVYDRSGKTIYKWNNLDGQWDGKNLNGKEMPQGFYLYSIFAESADSKHHSKKGTLYIFR